MRVAVIFDNFGPYHIARLSAAAHRCDLLAIEVNESSRDYPWARPPRALKLNEITLFQCGEASALKAPALRMRLADAIASHRSEVVFVPGWASVTSLISLKQCLRSNIPAVVMSDSQAIDRSRSVFREGIKSRVVGLFSAGLVGGQPHAKYLAGLGMPSNAIFQGYDAVDNEYFASATESARQLSTLNPLGQGGYFLAVSRFVEKKNLPMLLASFAEYRQAMIDRRAEPYSLMLLGDGPLRVELERLRSTLGLDQAVLMQGFVQYDKLPGYMAGARALIHASTVEQWGLVVNEAMASGVPVIVSSACGCAADLVVNGVTGFQFDPCSQSELVRHMIEVTVRPEAAAMMGRAASNHIEDWGVERFATGVFEAAQRALAVGPKAASLKDRVVLAILAAR